MFETSLLCVSVTVNVCSLSYFALGRLIDFLGTKYAGLNGLVTTVTELHNRKPWLFGKLVTELSATCLLAIMAVVTLSTTSVYSLPFIGNQSLPVEPLVETVMSVNIGRYVYMIAQDCFLHCHLTHFKSDLIHHLVTIGAYVVFLTYKQNLFLSIAGLFMEVNLIPIEAGRLLRMVDKHSTLCRKVAIASCIVTLVTRGVVPIAFLTVAVQQESPFTMMIAPLTVFFLCIVFFFVINFWVILQTITRVIKYSPCGPGEVDENMQNYITVRNPTEPHSRHVTLPGGNGGKSSVTFSSLNYGYLKCYDNRNVCNNDNDKTNLNSKKVSKQNIGYTSRVLSPGSSETNEQQNVVNNCFSNRRVRFENAGTSGSSEATSAQAPVRSNQSVNRIQPTSFLGLSHVTETIVPTNVNSNPSESHPMTNVRRLTEVV